MRWITTLFSVGAWLPNGDFFRIVMPLFGMRRGIFRFSIWYAPFLRNGTTTSLMVVGFAIWIFTGKTWACEAGNVIECGETFKVIGRCAATKAMIFYQYQKNEKKKYVYRNILITYNIFYALELDRNVVEGLQFHDPN